jgi:RNA polymerase sigma-70 factor, ECF subfamily
MYKAHETPQFWSTYGEALEKYLLKNVPDKSIAGDILHDVYLKIFLHCQRYDFSCEKAGVSNLRSWVFQTCHNTMIDYIRANAPLTYPGHIEAGHIIDPEPDPQTISAEQLIRQLPPKYAALVFEDIILNTKQAEIALKYGLTLPGAKSRIQRGKKMLHQLYQNALKN